MQDVFPTQYVVRDCYQEAGVARVMRKLCASREKGGIISQMRTICREVSTDAVPSRRARRVAGRNIRSNGGDIGMSGDKQASRHLACHEETSLLTLAHVHLEDGICTAPGCDDCPRDVDLARADEQVPFELNKQPIWELHGVPALMTSIFQGLLQLHLIPSGEGMQNSL